MIDYVVYLFGCELVLHWYGNSAVCQCGEECHSPVAAVASAQGYLVAALHTAVFEHDVEFFDFPCYIVELQCCAFVVGECVLIPKLYYAVLYILVKTWYLLHCTIFKILCKGTSLFAHFQNFCAVIGV